MDTLLRGLLADGGQRLECALQRLASGPTMLPLWGRRPTAADIRQAQIQLREFLQSAERHLPPDAVARPLLFLMDTFCFDRNIEGVTAGDRTDVHSVLADLHLACSGGAPSLATMRSLLTPFRSKPSAVDPPAIAMAATENPLARNVDQNPEPTAVRQPIVPPLVVTDVATTEDTTRHRRYGIHTLKKPMWQRCLIPPIDAENTTDVTMTIIDDRAVPPPSIDNVCDAQSVALNALVQQGWNQPVPDQPLVLLPIPSNVEMGGERLETSMAYVPVTHPINVFFLFIVQFCQVQRLEIKNDPLKK